MRFDRATIALVPRSTTQCLDLAFLFYGQHLRRILSLWLLFAVPCCTLVYVIVNEFYWNMWLPLGVFYVITGPYGAAVTAGAAASAFGEPFTLRTIRRHIRSHGTRLIFPPLALRLATAVGAALCLIPGLWVAVNQGFLVEETVLANLRKGKFDFRTKELVRSEFFELLGRGIGISAFCLLLWLIAFVMLDTMSSLVLGFPILFDRLNVDLSYLPGLWEALVYIGDILWRDPRVLTAWLGTGLLVYPFGRLAWFFCYIDLRVRRDCWDMELRLDRTAERLEVRA